MLNLTRGKITICHFSLTIRTLFPSVYALRKSHAYIHSDHGIKHETQTLPSFDFLLLSANMNNLKEPDLSCCYFHMQSIFYPPKWTLRVHLLHFPFYLKLFPRTSFFFFFKQTYIKIYHLILFYLEALLSTSSLHSQTATQYDDDLMYFWELKAIIQTALRKTEYLQLPWNT